MATATGGRSRKRAARVSRQRGVVRIPGIGAVGGRRLWTIAIALFWLILLAFCADWIPWLRGVQEWGGNSAEWRWVHKVGEAPIGAAILVALAMAGIWGVQWLAPRFSPRGSRPVWVALILGLYLLLAGFQAAATYTRTPRVTFLFAQRTYIEWLNSFFLASLTTDSVAAAWTDFDRILTEDKYPRVVTHPPGFVAYYAAARNAVEAAGIAKGDATAWREAVEPLDAARTLTPVALVALVLAAFLQPLFANLALIPIFDLVRRRWSTRVALRVAFLYCLVPGVVLFVPSPDEFFLPLAAIALWGFCLGCDARLMPGETGPTRGDETARTRRPPVPAFRPGYLVIAGTAVGIHSLFGYHFSALMALFVLWRLMLSWRDSAMGFRPSEAARRAARDLAVFLAPILAIWLVLWIAFDFSYISHWITGVEKHRFGITQYRSYWAWLLWNLWDVAFFLGLPALAAIGWAVLKRRAWLSAYVIALVVVVLAIDLSGAVRGETARILMFLYPLLIPLAAPFLADETTAPGRFRLLAVHQLAQLVCMALYLNLF